MRIWDSTALSPWDRVKVANELALRFAMDPPLRRLAAAIVAGAWSVPGQGPKKIAGWIRRRFQYALEAPGVEILQGPYTSLKTRVVDCDDAALLWVTLTRAIGLQTYFCGVGDVEDPGVLLHAIGLDAATDRLYELIDDSTYGGSLSGLRFRLPPGYFVLYYSPEPGQEGFYSRTRDGAFLRVQ